MFYRWTTGQLWKFYFLWISLNHPLQVFIRKLVKCWNTLPVQFLHITDCHFFMIHLGRSKTFVTVVGNKFRITFFVICWSHIRHNKSLIRVMGLFPHCLGPLSHDSGANVKTKPNFLSWFIFITLLAGLILFIPNYLILFQISFQGQSRLTEIQPGDHTHGHVLQPHKEVHSSAKDF